MSAEEAVELIIERAAAKIARDMRGIVADRVYPPDEAAELLGYISPRAGRSLLELPPKVLPRVPVTPGGRVVGFLGRDLLQYIKDCRKSGAP